MQGPSRWLAVLSMSICWSVAGCASMKTAEEPSMNAESRLRVAEAAEQAGNMDLALSMYTAAADNAPDDTAIQLRCADALVRNGKWTQARDLLTARLKAHPHESELLRGLASLYVLSGQAVPAIARLDEALAARPHDTNALVDKAVALDLQSHHVEAQRLYRQALLATPADPIISNDLAVSLMIEGRTQEAQAVLAPFADMEGVPDRLKINLGIIYAANGDTERARRLLDGHIGDGELSTLTQAIASSAAAPAIKTP